MDIPIHYFSKLYRYHLFFIIDETIGKGLEKVNKVNGLDITLEKDDFSTGITVFGYTYRNNDCYVIIVEKQEDDVFLDSVILHECDHVVNDVLDKRGIIITANNDEPHTYLLQHLFLVCKKHYINETIGETKGMTIEC